jgi:heterodisulfide reductase subunit B
MKLGYYPGCSVSGTSHEFGTSMEAVAEPLGIELVELPDWNCCGASSAVTLDHELAVGLAARNLAQGEAIADQLFVPCAACFNRLRTGQQALQEEPDLRERLDPNERPREAGPRVLNLIHVFDETLGAEALKERVKRPLTGLKPAAYYGCLLLRPEKVCGAGDVEQPQAMERTLQALGAEPVTWYGKTDCCGAALSATKAEIVVKLATAIAERARRAGANCLVTACPLCQMNLESRQRPPAGERLPVFYLTQVVGIALGLSARALGLETHLVSPRPLLKSLDLWAA